MDQASAAREALSISEALPFLKITLDYTDKICALIPQQLFDYRPADPTGAFQFSLGEIAMHVSDERFDIAGKLSGSLDKDSYWLEHAEWQSSGAWKYRQPRSMQEVHETLRRGREVLNQWMSLPQSQYFDTTAATREAFERRLAKLRESGKEPTEELLRHGPETVGSCLTFLAAHEAGHRGTLQGLLRQQGVDASFKSLLVKG